MVVPALKLASEKWLGNSPNQNDLSKIEEASFQEVYVEDNSSPDKVDQNGESKRSSVISEKLEEAQDLLQKEQESLERQREAEKEQAEFAEREKQRIEWQRLDADKLRKEIEEADRKEEEERLKKEKEE
mgnify:CR=1 FL=1